MARHIFLPQPLDFSKRIDGTQIKTVVCVLYSGSSKSYLTIFWATYTGKCHGGFGPCPSFWPTKEGLYGTSICMSRNLRKAPPYRQLSHVGSDEATGV
jgi:hypothetical protein